MEEIPRSLKVQILTGRLDQEEVWTGWVVHVEVVGWERLYGKQFNCSGSTSSSPSLLYGFSLFDGLVDRGGSERSFGKQAAVLRKMKNENVGRRDIVAATRHLYEGERRKGKRVTAKCMRRRRRWWCQGWLRAQDLMSQEADRPPSKGGRA